MTGVTRGWAVNIHILTFCLCKIPFIPKFWQFIMDPRTFPYSRKAYFSQMLCSQVKSIDHSPIKLFQLTDFLQWTVTQSNLWHFCIYIFVQYMLQGKGVPVRQDVEVPLRSGCQVVAWWVSLSRSASLHCTVHIESINNQEAGKRTRVEWKETGANVGILTRSEALSMTQYNEQ